MSQNRSGRGRQQGKGRSRGKGNNKRGRSRNQNRGRKSGTKSKRPFWENDAAEARVHAMIDLVRPAHDPSALVRSLGPPPLGKFADNAQHYYAAVYTKAQRFAVAMATANGVLVMEDDDDGATVPSDGTAAS